MENTSWRHSFIFLLVWNPNESEAVINRQKESKYAGLLTDYQFDCVQSEVKLLNYSYKVRNCYILLTVNSQTKQANVWLNSL